MSDLTSFQRAIVRISNTNSEFFGVGILLQPDLALTCAHVVADALNYDRDLETAPTGIVQLNLPFVDEANVGSAKVLMKGWFSRNNKTIADLALLHLDKPLEADGYVCLSPAFSLTSLQFEAWGGQEGHEQHLIP